MTTVKPEMKEALKALARRVQKLRLNYLRPDGKRGLSQQELARLAGCAAATVWRIEQGNLKEFPLDLTLSRLAHALGEKIVEEVG